MILPFYVPKKINLGDYKINNLDLKDFEKNDFDLSQYIKLVLDDVPINLSKDDTNLDKIQEILKVYHKGESFTINDILEGKLGGRTIALGESINILIKVPDETLKRLTIGKHSLIIENDKVSNLEIAFELEDNNMNLKFDPTDT